MQAQAEFKRRRQLNRERSEEKKTTITIFAMGDDVNCDWCKKQFKSKPGLILHKRHCKGMLKP